MCSRLVQKSVTLNDLERHNGCLIASGANYVNVVKDRLNTCIVCNNNVVKKSSFQQYMTYGDIRRGCKLVSFTKKLHTAF